MRRLAIIVLTTLAALTGCNGNPPPVPMVGPPSEIEALAGEWRGSYEADPGTSGRAGSILFRLAIGQDTAYGDVLMVVPTSGVRVPRPQDAAEIWPEPGPQSAVLSIRFVRTEAGEITGLLDPYTDPACGCTLRTTFTGRLHGDTIEGTFSSVHLKDGFTTGGHWKVNRRRQ